MAGFNDDDIRAVREKTNIVDVVAERVRLKKSGRTFKGLCPFHNEKSPSFHVDPAKQLYHCFGCGAGGDAYSFLIATEGLDFVEAVETLARRVGHPLTKRDPRQAGKKTRLLKACEEAATFYERALRLDGGAAARDYLKSRGLAELAVEFRLGFSPDWTSLLKYLKNQGIGEAEMIEAGLAARSVKGGLYDRLKGRVIFPILDNQGRTIAFGGRVLDDSTPKYLNSPETPLYHKGSVLYGLSQAKSAFLQTETALLVEGYTDLLASVGAGIRNVVATLGTAFTEDHLRLLGRFVDRVVLIFDGDEAGLNAAERSSEYLNLQRLPGSEALDGLIANVETELSVAVVPTGLDPADLIAEKGVAAFSELVGAAKPLGFFLLDRIVERAGVDGTGKMKAVAEAAPMLAGLSSPVAKEEYMRYLGERLNVSFEALAAEIKEAAAPAARSNKRRDSISFKRITGPERELLRAILEEPKRAGALGDLDVESWPDPKLRRLAAVLKESDEGKDEKISNIIHRLDIELKELVSELVLEPFEVRDLEESDAYFTGLYLKCKEASLDKHIERLKKELQVTDSSNKRYDEVFEELVAMEYKRRELKNKVTDGGSLWVRN